MKTLNISNSVTTDKPIVAKEEEKTTSNKDRLHKFMQEEKRLVKGRFRCYETPGSRQKIQQRKYPGPVFDKWMTDGETYEVPLWVARWLNGIDITAEAINGKINSCSYPIHGFLMQHENDFKSGEEALIEGGVTVVPKENIVKRERRYGFESLEFSVE